MEYCRSQALAWACRIGTKSHEEVLPVFLKGISKWNFFVRYPLSKKAMTSLSASLEELVHCLKNSMHDFGNVTCYQHTVISEKDECRNPNSETNPKFKYSNEQNT